jgi:lipoate-protein ligase A
MQHINTTFPEAKNYNFTAEDEKAIGQLMATRYSLWDWNFGYSPKFTFRNQSAIKGEFIEIDLEVDQGIIKQISIKANSGIVSDASEILINTSYKEATIQAKLQQLKHENANSWINLFF